MGCSASGRPSITLATVQLIGAFAGGATVLRYLNRQVLKAGAEPGVHLNHRQLDVTQSLDQTNKCLRPRRHRAAS
jgi:hypothetical protein